MSRHARRPDERFRLGPWLVFLGVLAVLAALAVGVLLALEALIESTTFVG